MDLRLEILLLILGCAFITLLDRTMPIVFFRNWQPPRWFIDWFGFIPTAVMSSLVGLAIFFPEKSIWVWQDIEPFLYASLPATAVAFITKSLGITVLVGVVSMYIVLRFL